MGSQEHEEYLPHDRAAELLGVSRSTLYRMVARGIFVPLKQDGKPHYRKTELQFFKANYEKEPDIYEIRALALQALSTARRAEERLAELYERMGVNVTALMRDESSVKDLYKEAELALVGQELKDNQWVKFWSGSLFAMDETYLELVSHIVDTEEPWKVFFDATTVVLTQLAMQNDEGLRLVIKRLEAAQAHLRYVGYMYCRRTHGPKIANTVFDGRATAVEELSSILFD